MNQAFLRLQIELGKIWLIASSDGNWTIYDHSKRLQFKSISHIQTHSHVEIKPQTFGLVEGRHCLLSHSRPHFQWSTALKLSSFKSDCLHWTLMDIMIFRYIHVQDNLFTTPEEIIDYADYCEAQENTSTWLQLSSQSPCQKACERQRENSCDRRWADSHRV